MIKIICVGKIKEKYLNELIDDYVNRIKKYHKIEIIEIKDDKNEDENLFLKIPKGEYNILLDIKGKSISSNDLAIKINNLFNNYSNINFIIGGSFGVSNRIKNIVNEEISFSQLTFPHGLFRGILLEQIYRTFKINNNETYHK